MTPLPKGLMHKLSQFPSFDQLFHVIMESSTILDGVPTILVILIVKTLVALRGITSHFVWPLEVWLGLYLFKDLMNELLKHCTNQSTRMPSMSNKIPPRSVIVISLCPIISLIRGNNLCLPLPLLLILLDPFILINSIHELTHTSCKLHCKLLS